MIIVLMNNHPSFKGNKNLLVLSLLDTSAGSFLTISGLENLITNQNVESILPSLAFGIIGLGAAYFLNRIYNGKY